MPSLLRSITSGSYFSGSSSFGSLSSSLIVTYPGFISLIVKLSDLAKIFTPPTQYFLSSSFVLFPYQLKSSVLLLLNRFLKRVVS